jgi:hypothetical protein
MHAYPRCGFLALSSVLDGERIAALRDECDALRADLTPEALCEAQCVVDIADPPPESGAARTDPTYYLRHTRRPLDGVLARLLLSELPAAVAAALQLDDAAAASLTLFNEHYVVKPPRSGRFVWHTDGAHQHEAALLLGGGGAPPPEYVSVWCPLDDIGGENGALVLLPRDAPQPPAEPGLAASEATASVLEAGEGSLAARVRAGTAVLFSSSIWHCSEENRSGADRSVY